MKLKDIQRQLDNYGIKYVNPKEVLAVYWSNGNLEIMFKGNVKLTHYKENE